MWSGRGPVSVGAFFFFLSSFLISSFSHTESCLEIKFLVGKRRKKQCFRRPGGAQEGPGGGRGPGDPESRKKKVKKEKRREKKQEKKRKQNREKEGKKKTSRQNTKKRREKHKRTKREEKNMKKDQKQGGKHFKKNTERKKNRDGRTPHSHLQLRGVTVSRIFLNSECTTYNLQSLRCHSSELFHPQ